MGKILVSLPVLAALLLVAEGAPGSRIVGGQEAPPGRFPYMVSLKHPQFDLPYDHYCGGSILTKRTILTSAVCVIIAQGVADGHQVYVGSNLLSEGGQVYNVSGWRWHPQFNAEESIDHDVGVIYLDSDLVFTQLVQPIELDSDYTGEGVQATVSGWGYTYFDDITGDGDIPNELQYLNTTSLSQSECKAKVPDLYPLPHESHVCFSTISAYTCWGDNGSPVVWDGKQIGIASWGFCEYGIPDGAARISADYDWIRSVTI